MLCPCHSGLDFNDCCEAILQGKKIAETAEQLMRSRYSAFSLGNVDYLKSSWHPDFVPNNLSIDPAVKWLGLSILNANQNGDSAEVEFEAKFLTAGLVDGLHECSRFIRQQGKWFYTDGDMLPVSFKSWKPGRNETCPCGSGKKFKRCCG